MSKIVLTSEQFFKWNSSRGGKFLSIERNGIINEITFKQLESLEGSFSLTGTDRVFKREGKLIKEL
jgi:hypothetical protein